MIRSWRKVLVLAPHTDDGEFGCGGTLARLVENGTEVRYVAFSIATRSLPEGFPPDTLAREVREATAELGIPEALVNSGAASIPLGREATVEDAAGGIFLLCSPWSNFVHGQVLHVTGGQVGGMTG